MTSKERHEARYLRRKNKRQQRRMTYSKSLGNFEDIFSFDHLYKSGKNCCKGVMWKHSVQSYANNLTANTSQLCSLLEQGRFKSKGFHSFDITERGKLRHIKSVHITERVVQRCLCDYSLVPAFSRAFIYDNAASLKDKGIDFAMDRLNLHLHRFYNKYGKCGLQDGYVLVGDFRDYFNSAPHDVVYKESLRRIHDKRIVNLSNYFMENYGEVGYGLGSQVSQIDALMVANPLDHFIKERLGIKFYGRYMDDFYLIHEDKTYLETCLTEIQAFCDKLGLELNKKKTRIYPIKRGIKFLKIKFILTDTGKVIRKMDKKSKSRMKNKLKKFKKWVINGTFTMKDVETSYQSWRGHALRGNSENMIREMDHFYAALYN